MSAWIVSKQHIDALVDAGYDTRRDHSVRWYHGGTSYELTAENRDAVGQMLWQECHASVAHRYDDTDDGKLPGPIGLTRATIAAYTHTPATLGERLAIPALLKQISCYEYQSCEHDGWEASQAHAFCTALRHHLIGKLPGYEAADWGL